MPQASSESIRPHGLTWSVLLAKWVEFARSAVALSSGGAEGLFKQSVPDIIGLQAVWFALDELAELSPEQRALGIDRAAVLIAKHTEALQNRWSQIPLPEGIAELITDAQDRLEKARGLG